MSIHRAVILGMLLAALFVVIGCEGDQGPAGPEGTAVCGDCHSDNTLIVAITAQWENSVHANGGNFDRNSSTCSRCHTSEGFVAYLETGEGGEPLNPSAIGCFTCHMPHTNYNFDLRISEPVEFDYGGTFNLGNGNLCANCHQIRVPNPAIPDTGTVHITSFRWGPHHGPQANVLAGVGAYVYPGASYGSSGHSNAVTNGCPTCHMSAASGASAGGHTWNLVDADGDDHIAGCESCHPSLEDFDYGNVQADVEVLLTQLATLLADSNLFVGGRVVVPADLTANQAGSILNYLIMEEDRSLGIHNPTYVKDVLEASIAAMGG